MKGGRPNVRSRAASPYAGSMETSTALALLSAVIAAVIAIVVPWLAFHLALRQDHTRWLRERRAEVYVDLLTEAYAEQQWLEFDMADDDTRQHWAAHFHDLRLPPLERARLGVRASMFASRTVNQLFNRIPAEAFWSGSKADRHEGDRLVMRVRIAGILDDLQAAIREEMGTDKHLPVASSSVLSIPTRRSERWNDCRTPRKISGPRPVVLLGVDRPEVLPPYLFEDFVVVAPGAHREHDRPLLQVGLLAIGPDHDDPGSSVDEERADPPAVLAADLAGRRSVLLDGA
jgi:hypothetical protein